MPYLNSDSSAPNQSEQDKKQNETAAAGDQITSATPTLSGGGGSSQTPIGPSQGQVAGSPKGTSSGQFTNLQSYLNANAGNNAAAPINIKIGDLAGKAESDLQSTQNTFDQQAQAGSTDYNQDLINNAVKDPLKYAGNTDLTNQFHAQLNDTYKGPNQLQDITNYSRQPGQDIQNYAQQTKNAPGQFQLLQKLVGRPTYTQGEQNLDQLLLQAPNAQASLNKTYDQYGQELNKFDTAETSATQQAQARAAQAQQASTAARTGVNTATSGIQDPINAAIQAKQAEALRDTQIAKTGISGKTNITQMDPLAQQWGITGSTMDALPGLIPDESITNQANFTYGVDPTNSQYLSLRNPNQFNATTMTTPEQQSRLNALAQLGQTQNTFASNDPNTLGSMINTSPYTFNRTAYQNAVNDAKTQYLDKFAKMASAAAPGIVQQGSRTNGQINNQEEANFRNVLNGVRDLNQQYGLPGMGVKGATIGPGNVVDSNAISPVGQINQTHELIKWLQQHGYTNYPS